MIANKRLQNSGPVLFKKENWSLFIMLLPNKVVVVVVLWGLEKVIYVYTHITLI